jgi:hypothetical protein
MRLMTWRALTISPYPRSATRPPTPPCPGSRVSDNQHSNDVGARLTFRVNAHTDARSVRRRRRLNVDRVVVLNDPPATSNMTSSCWDRRSTPML